MSSSTQTSCGPWVNAGDNGGGAADDDLGKFGPIALYVGGAGAVHFRDVSYRDLSLKRVVKEELSPNYSMLRLTPFYYSFASGRRGFRPRRQHGYRLGPLHLPGTGFHEGARVLHGALHQPLDELLVELARVRRRLHGRWLARCVAGVDIGHSAVRESERRAAALGFVRGHRAAGEQRRPKCRR